MRVTLLAALLSGAMTLTAQTPVTVRGVAYDSLRAAPLTEAFVTMSGGSRAHSATTDTRGRFQFDSVVPGSYTLSMQHPAIDSLGFPGFARRVVLSGKDEEVRIAVPSFATLWRAACGATPAPRDSGFVYGVVH